jgi:uncharacterized protein YcfJ
MRTETRVKIARFLTVAALASTLIACATIPSGPNIAVMPGPGKPFDVFQADNLACKDYAYHEIGVNPDEIAKRQIATGAVTGAVVGAAAGAAIGHGDSHAAGTLAGMGALGGAAIGADAASQSRWTLQRRYDVAYAQCMYAKGNQVSGFQPQKPVPLPPRRR